MSDVAGIILAGGLSRRMGGGDKALRMLGGKPMIVHVIDRLAPQVGPMVVNANGDPADFAPFGLPVIADSIAGHAGPLAGVLAGMDWAGPKADHIVTAATDTPFFPADLVARFLDASAPDRIVMARSGDNRHPVFALWPLSLRHDLAGWLARSDTMKVLAWAGRHDLAFVDFDISDRDPFFNANTPEDLAQAEAWLAGQTA